MRVAIVGGTGFVGGYLIDALVAAGHEVVALVRPGSEEKLRAGERVTAVAGDLGSAEALGNLVDGCDAAIYNVGLLREFPQRGITFEQAQFQGVVDTVSAMQEAGVRRLLLMSAIGVKHPGTRYQSTKRRAEEHQAREWAEAEGAKLWPLAEAYLEATDAEATELLAEIEEAVAEYKQEVR